MIPVQIAITGYDISKNVCTAKLQNGNLIELDPFVGCAVAMTDAEYQAGKGAHLIGKNYVLTAYSVYPDYVVPHENGMHSL